MVQDGIVVRTLLMATRPCCRAQGRKTTPYPQIILQAGPATDDLRLSEVGKPNEELVRRWIGESVRPERPPHLPSACNHMVNHNLATVRLLEHCVRR